ncbi:putative zinc finger protein [Humibacillus xanthopallidus]|uniref:Putative zinc finger protein n=1 Tax=Humibacillus xanthopallidus TaxID=412689 RepID=A0A543PNW3_9MICO|nr:zf-HC2 domain-containing protein [Humibacillus xanthopallidus]TQN45773.1 putative zinc finger protein [Humibacillus xanthopallidus]
MTDESDGLHVLLGGYLLGGLSDADHSAFTEHLRTCAACQAELGQVSGLPRLLALAGPAGGPHLSPDAEGDAAAAPSVSDDEELPRLLSAVARRRQTRRRWFTAVAAAAAAVLFGAGLWLGPRLTAPPELPTTHVVAAPAPGSSVRVDVALVTRGWGTQLDLDCEDMPTSGQLTLYVIDRKGGSTAAASWRGTPTGYSQLTGATALRPNEIQRLEIRDGKGQVLASATT